MKRVLIMLLSLACTAAGAQQASQSETNAVVRIAECIAEGAPHDWTRLFMVVELAEPGAETGQVRYLAARASDPEALVAYVPCDTAKPARILLEARKHLPPERKGWTGARLTLENSGKFGINYDYPK